MAKSAAVKPPKKPLKSRLWNQRYLFLLMLPAVVWVVFICYAPMTGLYMAFTNYSPTTEGYFHDLLGAPFVGVDWFEYFFQNDFVMIMRNTLATSLLTLLFSFPAPILIAIFLNEVRSMRMKKFVQTASYLPYFISWVIAANIFLTFLSGDGVVNDILQFLHFTDEDILFFQKGPYFWWIIAIANTWKVMGYNAIIYLAAISGIDQEQYEAARVDGANRFQQMLHITLPGLVPTIMILFILRMGNILNVGYEKVLLLYNPNTYDVADIISTYTYRLSFPTSGGSPMYSKSTAIGLFNTLVNVVFLLITNAISKKATESSLF